MEEISLRQYIEVLLKGKWIIAIFTAICILVSVVYAQFIMKPIYSARAVLMVSPVEVKAGTDRQNQFAELVESLSQYPQMTLDTYKEQVLTPVILDEVIKELALEEQYGINRIQLRNMATIESPNNTNLLYVSIKHMDPQLGADIANMLSQKYVEFISNKVQQQTGQSAEFITQQLEIEKANVDKATAALTVFLAQPRGVSELRQELSSKLAQLTSFKTQVVEEQITMESTGAALEQTRIALGSTPATLKTTKSLINDAQTAQASEASTSDAVGELEMTDEQINPAYTALSLKVKHYEIELEKHNTRLNSLAREITAKQREIDQMQAELAEKENKYRTLTYEVNLAKQTRDAYQQKLKEVTIKQSAEIGKTSVIVISEALPPLYPTNGKTTIVAIAAVLGMMISAFVVLFRDYWETSSGEKVEIQ